MRVLSKSTLYKARPKLYKALVTATALGASQLVNRSMDYGWKRFAKEDPPRDPLTPHITWRKAIMWIIVTGIFVSLARFFAERLTFLGWARALHEDPRRYK